MADVDVSRITTVLLAGGKGTRLRPLTAVFPKPLVPLGDKPIIEILLRRLAASGFRTVTLCSGYLGELLMAVCGDGSRFGLSVNYVQEETPLGTAGPLSLIDTDSDPVLVMNGDLLTTMDFHKMIASHVDKGAEATIALFKRDVPIDFGVIDSDESGTFQGYREKPIFHFEVSMGVYILSRDVIEQVKPGKHLDMPDLILHVQRQGGLVNCYREDCFWLDIGRMDDYAKAQDVFTSNEAQFLGAPT
jgi:NDP-sugar pyrophosphorylase family protein